MALRGCIAEDFKMNATVFTETIQRKKLILMIFRNNLAELTLGSVEISEKWWKGKGK